MNRSNRRAWWRSGCILSLLTLTGLLVESVPAHASPSRTIVGQAPADLADPLATVSRVGPQIVDIDTKLGFQNAAGAGTGIVIDPNGIVLTNNHVIAGATDISARDIGNGQSYPATVIGYDRTQDIAVVQLDGAAGLPVANIGDSNRIAAGQPIVSLGNAGGVGGTPSAVAGRVVAVNQKVSAADSLTGSTEMLDGLIQVDASIRPGDSGGPTVNADNQVIGITTAASDNFKLGRAEGFAIPINQAMSIAGQIRSGVASPTVHIGPSAFLGVGVNDASRDAGAVVRGVVSPGPAEGAGIRPGDVITSVDGTAVNSATALTNLLDQRHPGDTTLLGVHNSSGNRSVSVTLTDGPPG